MKRILLMLALTTPLAAGMCGFGMDPNASIGGGPDMTAEERAEARRLVEAESQRMIDIDPEAVGNVFSAYIAWKIDRGEVPGIDWSEEKLADFKFQCALAGILADGVRFSDYPDVTGADVNAACDKAVRLLIRPDG